MKATINAKGVLTVLPETEVEAYALRKWAAKNCIMGDNGEDMYVDSSGVIIAYDWPQPQTLEEALKCTK